MINLESIIANQVTRKPLTFNDHKYFFITYFSHYISYEIPPFHDEIFALTESETENGIVVAFRGSGKSTIITTSYPIWSILGKPQKKFVVIVSQTQRQARQHLDNIKKELESNQLLKDDLGPFEEISDEWGGTALSIKNYDAKITAVSMEQTIRGMKHRNHRPDLII